MPGENIGVLEIEIRDNASEAGEGLSSLATALGSVKEKATGGFGLEEVRKELLSFTKSINASKTSSAVFQNISAFGKGLVDVAKVIRASQDGFDTSKIVSAINNIKGAVSEGMHLGTAGTQIKNIREALMGEWNTDNAYQAGMALAAIGEGAKSLAGTSLGTKAKDISAVAKALNEYAEASLKVREAVGEKTAKSEDVLQGTGMPRMRLNLQFFGGRKSKTDLDEVASRQISKQYELLEEHQKALDAFFSRGKENISETAKSPVDSMLEKTSENIQNVSDEYKNMISGMGDTAVNMSAFDPSKLPLGMLGMTLRDLSQGVAQFTGNLNESFGLITTGANETADQMQEKFQDSFGMIVRDAKENASETSESLSSMIVPQREMFDNTQIEEGRISYDSLREDAIEVEGTVGDVASSVHGYLTGVVEDIQKVEEEADNAKMSFGQSLEEMLRNMYAATTGVGPALRGEKGDSAYFGAIKQIADMRGVDEAEVIHKLMDIRDDAREAKKEIDGLMESLNQPIQSNMNWSQGVDRMLGIGSEVKSAKDSMSAFLQGMRGSDEIAQNVRDNNKELAEASEKFQDAAAAAKEYADSAKKAKDSSLGLKETFSGLIKIFNTSAIGKLVKQFYNLAKRMAIRAIIRQLSSAFKEGVENVYRYSDAIGSSFASNMDNTATSLFQLKNAIGAAVAPAIQAVLPFINQFINTFIDAINKVNQLFALLNGQTAWTRALPYAQKAFDDQKKSAKGAHDAMKDLLADWDELNIIQSQNSGNGSGSSGKKEEDYSAMFEEVSVFDSDVRSAFEYASTIVNIIKDHFLEIYGAVKLIRTGFKLMKFSSAFAGIVGDLLALAAGGLIMKLTVDVVSMMNDKYIETGKEGWLVANILTTALGAGLAGTVIGKVMGAGAGIVSAGITFALSAGTTFAQSANVEDPDKKSKLDLLGLIETGIGAILSSAGLAAMGFHVLPAIGGGILITGLVATLKFALDMDAEAKETATAAAKRAFSGVDEAGAKIDPSEYIAALQAKLDELTVNAKLILSTYIEVPDLKSKYDEVITQLKGLETVIKGSDSISPADAEEFKKAWGTVMDTLDRMDKSTYSTLLTGLNTALGRAVGEAKSKLLELRKEFVKFHENLDERNAGYYTEMEDLLDKILENKYETEEAKQKDLDRYTQLSNYFANRNGSSVMDIDNAIESGKTLDFSKGKDSVEDAKEYINSVKQKIDEADKTFDDAVNAVKESYSFQLNQLYAEKEAGLIDKTVYDQGKSILDQVLEENLSTIEKDRKSAHNKIQDAYELLFRTMFERNTGTEAYWSEVIDPLLTSAKEAGAEIPDWIAEEFSKGIMGNVSEFAADSSEFAEMLYEASGLDPEKAVEKINNWIAKDLEDSSFGLKGLLESIFGGKHGYNLILDVFNKTELQGFDLLTDDKKRAVAEMIRAKFGENSEEILKLLKYDFKLDNESTETLEENTLLPNVDSVFSDEQKREFETEIEDIIGVLNSAKDYELDEDGIFNKEFINNMLENGFHKEAIKEAFKRLDLTMPEIDTKDTEEKTDKVAEKYEDMADRIKGAITSINGLGFSFDISGTNGTINVQYPVVEATAATGGFIRSGDLIMANENGNIEMMGRMGNQPVVANNQQIVNGISSGVAQANGDVVSELRTLTTLMQRMLNKEFVARAVPSSAWGGHNARSQEAYDKVTG